MKKTITKEFVWDCAHKLFNPNLSIEDNKKIYGACSNIHGHTYHLFVTVSGEEENGMVINFKDLKLIINKEIVNKIDHTLTLTKGDALIDKLKDYDIELIIVDYETTCENQLADYWNILEPKLKEKGVILEKLKLYETPTSYAELSK
jgi:6-pyruvoyltetrahydropterin/6-carboxytetrahydropterin synthase